MERDRRGTGEGQERDRRGTGEGQERDRRGTGEGHRSTSVIEWNIGKDEKATRTRFAYVKEKTSTTPHDSLPWAC
jgi:hypothetical protein